jgi:isoleucyl-tRNA synthetase
MAPFAPFAAEDIWQKLKNENDVESVHLAEWPHFAKASRGTAEALSNMEEVRRVVSTGLEARQKAEIPVRQPLARLMIDKKLDEEYLELIKDELNVKEVVVGGEFKLTTELTPELTLEGNYRELLRAIQDMRKKQGLTPNDKIILTVGEESRALVQKFESELKKAVLATEIKIGESIQVEI